MKSFESKIAVITGAGSGIGRSLAVAFSKAGAKLALNDWNADSLKETEALLKEGAPVFSKAFDVSNREEVYTFAQEVISHYAAVDILINNAGIAHKPRNVGVMKYEVFEKVININLWGVIYGTKAFLAHLEQRPEAAIVNISSVFGIIGQPLQSPYVVAKFGVRGFTETLRNELRKSPHLSITSVHPGGIKTNIVRNIEDFEKGKKEEFAALFEKIAKTTADSAAAQILKAIRKKKDRLRIGRDAKFIDIIARLFPRSYDKILYRNLKLPD